VQPDVRYAALGGVDPSRSAVKIHARLRDVPASTPTRPAGTRPSRSGGTHVAEQVGHPSIEIDSSSLAWRKSSASDSGGGGQCLEVAQAADRALIRDSKDPQVTLSFTWVAWQTFLDTHPS
jgi:hypothetical protein